jgi:hypothetical protein
VVDALWYPLAGVAVCALLWLTGLAVEWVEARL